MRFFWLNFHLPYACRHSGACCTAGWPIPIEPERAVLIRKGEWLEAGGVLPRDEHGACVFYDGRCTVYQHRPLSCVHFPYVCLIDARGVHVTLSHYCPTAASLLFEHDGPIAIVEGPSPAPALEIPEGLDARESLPPVFADAPAGKPRLMSWSEFSDWERDELRTLPPLAREVNAEFAPVIERYLAAKISASWSAYLGDGTAAVRESVRAAQTLLQAQIATACREAGRSLTAGLLLQAIRQTDLQLMHARSTS
jgi:Fe-S-cluster containining protein